MKRKKLWFILGGIFLFSTIPAIFLGIIGNSGIDEIKDIPITDFDLSIVEDGAYTGSYYFKDIVGATLLITVENHTITSIEVIEYESGKADKAEAIIPNIINEQSVLVDDIAGVTYSSRVLKLAVINALEE